jgi:hypothetical protein
MTAQQALAEARVDVETQRTRADALEAELKAAGAEHVRERTRAADDAEREARGLRSQLATLVGNQQYMESSLNRARCVHARPRSSPPSPPDSASSRRPHSWPHSRRRGTDATYWRLRGFELTPMPTREQADRAAEGAMSALNEDRERFKAALLEAQTARAAAERRAAAAERERSAMQLQLCGDGALEDRAREATERMNEAAREKEALRERAMKAEADRRTVELTSLAKLEDMNRRTEEELSRLTKSVRLSPFLTTSWRILHQASCRVVWERTRSIHPRLCATPLSRK